MYTYMVLFKFSSDSRCSKAPILLIVQKWLKVYNRFARLLYHISGGRFSVSWDWAINARAPMRSRSQYRAVLALSMNIGRAMVR